MPGKVAAFMNKAKALSFLIGIKQLEEKSGNAVISARENNLTILINCIFNSFSYN